MKYQHNNKKATTYTKNEMERTFMYNKHTHLKENFKIDYPIESVNFVMLIISAEFGMLHGTSFSRATH